jgi:hypothetical protein
MTQARYILGHSQEEIRRLISQAAILRPFTERLFRDATSGRLKYLGRADELCPTLHVCSGPDPDNLVRPQGASCCAAAIPGTRVTDSR